AQSHEPLRREEPRLEGNAGPDGSIRCAELKRLARAYEPSGLHGGVGADAQQFGSGDLEGLDGIGELRPELCGQPVRGFDQGLETPRPGSGQRVVTRRQPEMGLPRRGAHDADETAAQKAYLSITPREWPNQRKRVVRYIAPAHPPQGAVAKNRRRSAELRERSEPLQSLGHVAPPQQDFAIGFAAGQSPGLNRPCDRET